MSKTFGERLASWLRPAPGSPAESPAAAAGPARLVVGLGNPGRQYAGSRHNAGFEVVEHLAARLGWCPSPADFDRLARDKFDALMLEGPFSGPGGEHKLVLLKPMTYMNRSGEAIQKAARFYKVSPQDILVVVDELALPAGKIRLRASGSDGGHNGLRDVRRALGTDQYPRLRVGIDPPPAGFAGKDYVLGKYTPDQRRTVDETLPRAVDCCLSWLKEGIESAMNRFNAG
jgi:PTH1 family peptidyl-tRNA hydrolase